MPCFVTEGISNRSCHLEMLALSIACIIVIIIAALEHFAQLGQLAFKAGSSDRQPGMLKEAQSSALLHSAAASSAKGFRSPGVMLAVA